MELGQGVIGQTGGGGFQIGQGLIVVAVAMRDPAIGILKRRHIRAFQPPRNRGGAGQPFGVIAVGGDQAGQVVGEDDIARIRRIHRFIGGDGPIHIPRLFQRSGLDQLQGA